MGVLSIALGQWETRDDSKPQPEVRRAANTAMDAIDTMLAALHAMRSRLVGEIRASRALASGGDGGGSGLRRCSRRCGPGSLHFQTLRCVALTT